MRRSRLGLVVPRVTVPTTALPPLGRSREGGRVAARDVMDTRVWGHSHSDGRRIPPGLCGGCPGIPQHPPGAGLPPGLGGWSDGGRPPGTHPAIERLSEIR
nr:hypothetical protein StreXyl84_34820 [Streptomyces sp. Xyl84]